MKLTDLITPNLIRNLQHLVSIGLKPKGSNAEILFAKSVPGMVLKGGTNTLVDLQLDAVGIEQKATSSLKLLKKEPKIPKNAVRIPEFNCWARWEEHPLVVFRRPEVSLSSGLDAVDVINANIERAQEFHDRSLVKEDCTSIKSLVMQHSFGYHPEFTVFRFSMQDFELPAFSSLTTPRSEVRAFDDNGTMLYKQRQFTASSQNFFKAYDATDGMTIIVKHLSATEQEAEWEDLSGVVVLSTCTCST